MSQTKKYKPFDGSEETFELKIDSNFNIEKICRVLVECHQKDDQERYYYAVQGELETDEYDDYGNAFFTFQNHYSVKTMWPALAQVLFYDFPTIVEIKEGKAEIIDPDKHKKLIRSEVMRGRDDFLGKFGMSPYEAESLLSALSTGLPFPTMNRILNPETPAPKKPEASTETSL